MSDAAEIKLLLQAGIAGLVLKLAPEGHRSGRYWIAKNPTRNDRKPGSFWIAMSGGAIGCWRDEATGEKGDVFGLIAYLTGAKDFKEALAWAKGYLGLERMTADDKRAAVRKIEKDQAATERQVKEKLAADRRRAFALWLDAKPLAGTLGESYLLSRGIRLSALAKPPGAVKFMAAMRHVESQESWPGLVTLMDDPHGNNSCAIHRTWLARDGSGKAPVDPARKIWPAYKGLVIKLARGASGYRVNEAIERGVKDTLILCEGVEDGLSLAMAVPEARVWAAGSLGNLGEIVLPECIGEVIVAADNDWGKPQAERLFNRGVQALVRQGRPVRIARSPIGKDANDALRGEMVA